MSGSKPTHEDDASRRSTLRRSSLQGCWAQHPDELRMQDQLELSEQLLQRRTNPFELIEASAISAGVLAAGGALYGAERLGCAVTNGFSGGFGLKTSPGMPGHSALRLEGAASALRGAAMSEGHRGPGARARRSTITSITSRTRRPSTDLTTLTARCGGVNSVFSADRHGLDFAGAGVSPRASIRNGRGRCQSSQGLSFTTWTPWIGTAPGRPLKPN